MLLYHLGWIIVIHCIECIQNAAAQLLIKTTRKANIITILASLHWLPVCFRIDLKILLITF